MGTEGLIRVGAYLSVLVIKATWELLAPRRPLTASKLCRWGGNLTIVILNTVIARLFFMGGVVAVAAFAQERSWGLLNWVGGTVWLEFGLAVVVLDFLMASILRADEIGAVAEGLNGMLERMSGFNETLRAEVEHATAELRAANEELVETARRLFTARRERHEPRGWPSLGRWRPRSPTRLERRST